MILVKTKLGDSGIEGIGVFADEFIPKGTVVWKFAPGFDLEIKKESLASLSEPAKEQFLKYAYINKKTRKHVLCFDDSRFLNHSEHPNIASAYSPYDEEGLDIALRDIQKGEEILCDYREFHFEAEKECADYISV